MASSNIQIECSICMEEFNNSSRRPRGLPCLHHFCTQCLKRCIVQGRITCSVCRREYIITKVNDIPINNMLENVIEMYSKMASNSVCTNDSNDEEEAFTKGQCSKHRKCLCYFRCITHGIYICRECTVVEHPLNKCNIIEIKEEIMKEKAETLNDAQQSIVHLDSLTSNIETIAGEKIANITSKQAQVQDILQQIEEDQNTLDQVEQLISENKIISRQLKRQIRSLQSATTKSKMTKGSQKLQEKVRSLKTLLKELDEKYNDEDLSKILLKDPKSALHIIEKRNMEVYAVEDAIYLSSARSSKLVLMNGTLQLNALEKVLKPPSSATLIPIGSLMSVLCAQPVVYLDLEAAGRALGRLRILLTCGPKRKEQMLRLCTGQRGTLYKGACFRNGVNVNEPGECINFNDYLADDGNFSCRLPIIQGMEQDKCKTSVAGAVTGWADASFRICTTTGDWDTTMMPEVGKVIQGLDMLTRAIRKYTTNNGGYRDASQIKIVQTGVEICNSSEGKYMV